MYLVVGGAVGQCATSMMEQTKIAPVVVLGRVLIGDDSNHGKRPSGGIDRIRRFLISESFVAEDRIPSFALSWIGRNSGWEDAFTSADNLIGINGREILVNERFYISALRDQHRGIPFLFDSWGLTEILIPHIDPDSLSWLYRRLQHGADPYIRSLVGREVAPSGSESLLVSSYKFSQMLSLGESRVNLGLGSECQVMRIGAAILNFLERPVRSVSGTRGGGSGLFGRSGSLPHLFQLAEVNQRDYSIQDYGGRANPNEPTFATPNILFNLYGFIIFVAGSAIGVPSHFVLLYSRWSYWRLWKRLTLGIGGWSIAIILVWHGAGILLGIN
jgi:hypothetical protein